MVDPGNFIYIQGQIYDVGARLLTGAFIQGQQAIPEPGTLELLVMGICILGLTLARSWRKRALLNDLPREASGAAAAI
jgi:hypothetical protein